jgi:hypothetical protein
MPHSRRPFSACRENNTPESRDSGDSVKQCLFPEWRLDNPEDESGSGEEEAEGDAKGSRGTRAHDDEVT